ncbi:sugar-binding domain-containing protein [Sphingobacterium sp. FBM7-1]|uniref:exo-beta-1,4-galactosidase n=1 Tax=Sphingobacterium sp. FBM7-1 TaxID=2886688 RepID=UPI001D128D96|nr:sugar-binding domain-containing protein [Sphingobacterium sp. FBM7-1]MCC2599007.1 beta-glucuronidase [Sphingobacterium sp. FBM7-1]
MKKLMISCLYLFCLCISYGYGNDVISLAGNWRFEIDRHDVGITEQWYNRNLSAVIKLPGSMAESLMGDEITLETKWTGSIYDSSFYYNPKLEKFRQPGNIHIPFWLTPAKHYVGAAWYQKEVHIPKNWEGRRIVLHLERAHTETRVWINDQEVGLRNSLVAPHIYDLSSFLTSGENRISIRVDNSIKEINVGPDSHSISDHTQGNWNGIIGKIALASYVPVYIEEIDIFPDINNRKARVQMKLNNTTAKEVAGKVTISAQSFNTSRSDKTKAITAKTKISGSDTLEMELAFGPGMLTWDEFDPALYKLSVKLSTNVGETTKEVQFGMREFRIEGKQFLINGRPVFLRGTLNNCEFPLTGYPATTVDAWEKIFRTIKAHGLNHVRFHSWCPPEAAFIAADRIGLYLQPEAPSWPNHGPKIGLGEPVDQFLYDESMRIVKHYGNYASFTMLAAGNEPAGNQVEYLNDFVDFWKARDDRRVYTGMSVGGSWPVVPNAEFQVRGGVRGLAWNRMPESHSDFSAGISPFDVPFIAHENGQYCVYPNFEEIKKYKGVYKAKNMEMFRQILADQHMGDQANDFLNASGMLQALAYKHEIEKMLRTPEYAGFQLLGLQDFPGQGTALVGVLDAFWEEKGYISAQEYARFCNETVPLAKVQKFVFTNEETFEADIALFHAGKAPLTDAVVSWIIRDADAQTFEEGRFEAQTFAQGNGLSVGHITIPLNKIKNPAKLNLEVQVDGTSFANDWNFWVYPNERQERASSVYYTTTLDEQAETVLKNGGKVFLNASGKIVKGKEIEMHFLPVFWNTSWFKMRPPHVTGMLIQDESLAFADFPTSFHSDLQWWDIQHRAEVMNIEDFPADFRPLIQPIDTWFLNRRLALVYEAKVGNGKIVVSSADLGPDVQNKPASRQLFLSLQRYMESDEFNPKDELSMQIIKDVFLTPSREIFDTYTKDSPDELKPDSEKNKLN